MAVGLENEDRRFRRQLVEIRPGQLASRHDRGVKHLALYPGSGTGLGSRVADLLARVVHGGRREGADVQPGPQAGKVGMHVWVHEAGQDRVVAEIDSPGAWSPQIQDVVAATSRDDPAIPDRDRLHNRIAGVHGVNAPGEEDLVGETLIHGPGQRRAGCGHSGGEKASADTAQDVTTALQGPHDLHETFVAGVAHRSSSPGEMSAIRASKRQNFQFGAHTALAEKYFLRVWRVVNRSSKQREGGVQLTVRRK